MRLPFACNECISTIGDTEPQFIEIEANDDGVYDIECKNGHKAVILLQDHVFETLFDSGSLAFLDGYSREAVATIAASLERFYEFSIKVILEKNKVQLKDFDLTWKMVTKQSERQLGAFLFLYLLQFKRPPQQFDEKKTTFRNNVIHKGHFPTSVHAKEYIAYVFQYILDLLIELQENLPDEVLSVVRQRTGAQRKIMSSNLRESYSSMASMIRVAVAPEALRTFDFNTSLENLKKINASGRCS